LSNIGWTTPHGFCTIAPMSESSTKSQIVRLTGDFTESIRDPLWRDIPLSTGFKNLFSSEPMQKLSRIKQLGPAHLLYPGAVHTRLDHSLGVFHATRLIVLSLLTDLSKTDRETFFTQAGIQAVLAAAMLHDLGHFPYAHALKDVVSREHESLGAEMIAKHAGLRSIIEQQLGTSVDAVCQIIDQSLPCDDGEIRFFRTILSGTLDPDKLDYLSRDALFCGIPYGMQDASYIIRHLFVTRQNVLAIPLVAIGSVEHLLFAKYSMYRNVYWHPTTRGATAMIKKAVLLAMRDGLFVESDLYDLDDESFAVLFSRFGDSEASLLFARVRNNDLLVPLATVPFLADHSYHQRIYRDPEERKRLEQSVFASLARRCPTLAEHEVIIDIPEDLSFESDIPIATQDASIHPFSEIDELFSPQVVKAFTASLRKIRLYLPDHIEPHHALSALTEQLEQHHG